ncbi:hypothetical protein SAMN05892877_103327 [Rhizobium subbaraonis]|uniref:Uncharacterized protein n=1 Tax=Rhizobium subbaraonis TaxID=908946 RepID=A0A285U4Y1_9HYPH|nr:hypothetical protein SAMN05892877_103327 [Rhizobium subbaraonis]
MHGHGETVKEARDAVPACNPTTASKTRGAKLNATERDIEHDFKA